VNIKPNQTVFVESVGAVFVELYGSMKIIPILQLIIVINIHFSMFKVLVPV
jgi:hypothetical protein